MTPADIAVRFAGIDRVESIAPFLAGHINDSHVVSASGPHGAQRFFLQRLNPTVFPRPDLIMQNTTRVTAHLAHKARARSLALIPTRDGDSHLFDDDGGCWRVFAFVEGSRCLPVADTAELVELTGRAFGEFLCDLSDLPGPRLHEVLPGFHDTPARLRAFESAAERDAAGRRRGVADEIAFVERHAVLAQRLDPLRRSAALPQRIVHNDAKLSNILLDAHGPAALCVVDLDLVMPGLALFDFGDMVRSMISTAAEDETDTAKVQVRPDFFEALVRGYRTGCAAVLTPAETAHLVDGGIVITFEQALRFLGDFLAGDRYYRVHHPRQNLDRARTQIRLVEELLRHESELRRIVDSDVRRAG